ncbi:Siderophore iron transporter mirB [Paramyrothecium foliicola]|nr:Siderophore iron transporter mirB [Paramyrothecium foliicola]
MSPVTSKANQVAFHRGGQYCIVWRGYAGCQASAAANNWQRLLQIEERAIRHRVQAIKALNESLSKPSPTTFGGDARRAAIMILMCQAAYMHDAASVPYHNLISIGWLRDSQPTNARLRFTPAAIAVPRTTAHIEDAVACGVKFGVKVSAKSGGHSYASAGLGGEDGHLVLELENMHRVTVGADGTARIQPGARLGHVAVELFAQAGRAIPHGTCPGVGVGGHGLHGGYGMSSHTYGLTLDWIRGSTVTLANSTTVHCSATENEDLFWALRGAGSSFGIVSEFEFDTFPAPSEVTYYTITLNWNVTAMISGIKALQEFAVSMPAELNMRATVFSSSSLLEGVYYGSTAELQAIIAPLLAATGGELSTVKTAGWLESLEYFSGGTALNQTESYFSQSTFYASSVTVPALSDSQIEALARYAFDGAKTWLRVPLWWFQMDLHGGQNSAISKIGTEETAYPHRNRLLLFQLFDSALLIYPKSGYDLVKGFKTRITSDLEDGQWGMYANYPDTQVDSPTAQELYWGDNLQRLRRIKKHVGDFFAVIQLASRVRKDFVGAPAQFQHISNEFAIPAMSIAQARRQEAIMKLLLESKSVDIGINAEDKEGRTTLLPAVKNELTVVVTSLIDVEHIDVNMSDKAGRTALSWAAELGYDHVIKTLLAVQGVHVDGADLTASEEVDLRAEDEQGHTPYWIWFVYFAIGINQVLSRSLIPFVTSAFQRHSLTGAVGIMAGIISGLSKLAFAKVLDMLGRPQGLSLALFIYIIGVIMMAACRNIETYAAAQVFYSTGLQGIVYTVTILIADSSTLLNRPFMIAFSTSPYIITPFMGGPVAESVLAGPGWRYGIWAIIGPAVIGPLIFLFGWKQIKAKQPGVIAKSSKSLTLRSLKRFAIEVDAIGLLLLASGMALFLLPLSLWTYQQDGWESPMIICMLIFGGLLIALFVGWEVYLAPVKFIPIHLLSNRTAMGACLSVLFFSMNQTLYGVYLPSMLMVVGNVGVRDAAYITNIHRVGSSFANIGLGYFMRRTGRFKWVATYYCLPLTMLGVGLLLYFRHFDQGIGYVVMALLFIAFAAGPFIIACDMAIMASCDHKHVAVMIAVFNLFGSAGETIGQAISTSIWTGTFKDHLAERLPLSAPIDAIYNDIRMQMGNPPGSPMREAISEAYAETQRYLLIGSLCMVAVAWAISWCWKDIRVKGKEQVETSDAI